MHDDNGFFMKMCQEATDELARGLSWKEAPPNTLILAAFGMLSNHLTSKIVKPLWFFAGSVFTGMIGWLLSIWL